MRKMGILSVIALVGMTSAGLADSDFDFGEYRDHLLETHSNKLFGVVKPIEVSSTESISAAAANANPAALVAVAKGLKVEVVSTEASLGANIDMMALWPNDETPTHLIVCNEQGTGQPGVQRVRLSDGSVETILTGTSSCDPAHRTPWGTILVGEEAGGSGSVLEIIDPLHTTGVSYDRNTHVLSGVDAANVAYRPAVGHLSFEGVAIMPNGVMHYGDENRPSQGTPGGAYFKFIPSSPWAGGAPVSNLNGSPLADGQVYGLRLGKRSGNTDYGQGTNTGLGAWIEIPNSNDANLRNAAAALKLTGYYLPEDANADMATLAEGRVRVCANNTGNEEADRNWGETICITDGSLEEAAANAATPEVQLFVVGTPELAMMDNVAYQTQFGNWIRLEDGDAPGFKENPHNNDIWSCLEDGGDMDTLSDGCVRIATLNDLNAESTGSVFDAAGNLYFSVQHNVIGHGVIVKVSGWGSGN